MHTQKELTLQMDHCSENVDIAATMVSDDSIFMFQCCSSDLTGNHQRLPFRLQVCGICALDVFAGKDGARSTTRGKVNVSVSQDLIGNNCSTQH